MFTKINSIKQKATIFWRDLKIVTKAVWFNLFLYAILLLSAAILLSVSSVYPKATFLDLLVYNFHMSLGERVVESGDGILPSILTFLLPVFTAIVIGEGILRIFSVFVARGKHQEEWNSMVVNTYSNHIAIFGVGELGKALVKRIHLENPKDKMVLVDLRPGVLSEIGISGENVVFIQSDMTNIETLKKVNSHNAKLVLLASGNEIINLEAAYKIQQLNPQAQIWVRLHHSGLVDMLDLSKKENIHFFCPYQQAADVIVNQLLNNEHLY